MTEHNWGAEIADAIEQPTRHLQMLAFMRLVADEDAVAAKRLSEHVLDREPWTCDAGYCWSSRETNHEYIFRPDPGFCQHRECYS